MGADPHVHRRGDAGARDLTAGVANTHVVRHAGHTLALVESSFPYEITTDLETVGPYDFAGRLTTAMTAHPRTCPATGELHFFGYDQVEPYLTYHRADATGELVVSRPVPVAGPTMMHDFALTSTHVVFLDLPVVFRPGATGGPAVTPGRSGGQSAVGSPNLVKCSSPMNEVTSPILVSRTLSTFSDQAR